MGSTSTYHYSPVEVGCQSDVQLPPLELVSMGFHFAQNFLVPGQ